MKQTSCVPIALALSIFFTNQMVASIGEQLDTNGSATEGEAGLLFQIAAAVTYPVPEDKHAYLYLLTQKYVIVLQDRKWFGHFTRNSLHLRNALNLKSAFCKNEAKKMFVFYGKERGHGITYNAEGEVTDTVTTNYGLKRAFPKKGGPDAVGRRGDKVFAFKGCDVWERKAWNKWGKPQYVTSMGLPCKPDAAWKEDDGMVILKGDQIWRWENAGKITGPFKFSDSYDLKWWTLTPQGLTLDPKAGPIEKLGGGSGAEEEFNNGTTTPLSFSTTRVTSATDVTYVPDYSYYPGTPQAPEYRSATGVKCPESATETSKTGHSRRNSAPAMSSTFNVNLLGVSLIFLVSSFILHPQFTLSPCSR